MADPQKQSLNREHYSYGKEVARVQKMMADEKEMTDVILLCGEKKIPAHKLTLAAASPYFRTMFRSECKETVENVVELPTVTENTLTIILEFIYGSGFKWICWQNVEETIDVLEAAHLFEMKPLFNICCRELEKKLTLENCLQFWKLSNLYQDDNLRSQVFCFIKKNMNELIIAKTFLQMESTEFELLLTQLKVQCNDNEYFLNSVFDWINENRELRQSLIPLLSVNNLSKGIIKKFLKENDLSNENIEFLEHLSESSMKAKQNENFVELDVPLSSLKMLLHGKVDDQLAYQIVDFSGRSSAVKILPLNYSEIIGAVHNTSFYFMTKKSNENNPLYECTFSGRLLVCDIMEVNNLVELNQCFVVGDYFYVYGKIRGEYINYSHNYQWHQFFRCYNILKNTWYNLNKLIKDFQNITLEVEDAKGFFLIDKIDKKFILNNIVNNKSTNESLRYFPLPTGFNFISACCYEKKLFMFDSNKRIVVHNLIDSSTELKFSPCETGKFLFFPGFHSLAVGVETNIASSEAENWSHRLINLEDGQEISKILSTQINLVKDDTQVLFVSDISI